MVNNLITVELENIPQIEAYLLLRTFLNRRFLKSNSWHFLFEPQLIIRLNVKRDNVGAIRRYLNKEGISFLEYEYPSTLNDKRHNITKTFGDVALNKFQLTMLNNSSRACLKLTGKEYVRLIERTWHCMNNMASFDWKEEGIFGLQIAKQRLKLDKMSRLKRLLNYLAV